MLNKRILIGILIAILILIGAPLAVLLALSSTPRITVSRTSNPVTFQVADEHGIRHVAAYVAQDKPYLMYEKDFPAHRLFSFKKEPPLNVTFNIDPSKAPGLKDGPAKLIIEAASNDLRGKTAQSVVTDYHVVTHPPVLSVDDRQHYINQGGAELVLFSVAGYAADSGVKVDGFSFRSFPLPGKQERFSLLVFPWNVPASTVPLVFASNSIYQATKGFWSKVTPKKFRMRDLTIDDTFLQKVDNEIDPGGSGTLVERFLKINGPIRKQNNQTIADLRNQTEQRFLWSGAFLPFTNSAVESQFADVRTYVYKGKKIDTQVHLGFDLAKVKNTPIPAANDGRVVWAQRLGIYGNCVVIDHGYTLQSIYGHLSEIRVRPGDLVKKGQIIGLSGNTGLATGDHLHFSLQIDGVQTNPVEWWDAHWIHDRILSKVGPVNP